MKQMALEEAVAKASPSRCVHSFPLMHEFQEQNPVQYKENSQTKSSPRFKQLRK